MVKVYNDFRLNSPQDGMVKISDKQLIGSHITSFFFNMHICR